MADSTNSAAAIQPFHLAFPVHDLELARDFYGRVLGLSEGRSSQKWHDYSLFGHQVVCHLVESTYRGPDHFNPVALVFTHFRGLMMETCQQFTATDGDEVPVPHFGVCLTVPQFHALAERLRNHNVKFIIEPHIRFQGKPGEQWTMFFKDPSGNSLEFKAMTNPNNLFAKYYVE